jgi:hypothetical protein
VELPLTGRFVAPTTIARPCWRHTRTLSPSYIPMIFLSTRVVARPRTDTSAFAAKGNGTSSYRRIQPNPNSRIFTLGSPTVNIVQLVHHLNLIGCTTTSDSCLLWVAPRSMSPPLLQAQCSRCLKAPSTYIDLSRKVSLGSRDETGRDRSDHPRVQGYAFSRPNRTVEMSDYNLLELWSWDNIMSP